MTTIQPTSQKISPCLWFDRNGEDAAKFYVSIFPDSEIGAISRYGKEGFEVHGMPEGAALTIDFRLAGLAFTALNGGPQFKFTEAISLQVYVDDQAELDRYWDALAEGGGGLTHACGWLKDRYGLSWQIVPRQLRDLIASRDAAANGRVLAALMQMKKLDIAALEAAHAG